MAAKHTKAKPVRASDCFVPFVFFAVKNARGRPGQGLSLISRPDADEA